MMDLSFSDTPQSSMKKDSAPPAAAAKGTMMLALPQLDNNSTSQKSADDDSTLATPRSMKTTDEFDDPDINDMLTDKEGDQNKFLAGLNKFFSRQAKAFVRNFVDYGPPYTKKPFDGTLVNECSKPVMNHIELHKLLNNRLDPNIADPEDLYYFPIHWCARNIHFMAMKMLRRAGAKVNVTNELGCSPLDMCVMMKLPPDKRKDQLKMVKYLLENGADPNNRDKGGFSAIDQAAINQDLEIIQMLLEYGANVLRENHTLVAKRNHILRYVWDPDVYKVLYERLVYEQGEYEKRKIIRDRALSEKAAERHHIKLFQALDKRKEKRLAREAARDNSAKLAETMSLRHKHLQEEMEANLRTKEKEIQFQGVWTKDDVDHWTFTNKAESNRINSDVLYADNLATMNKLKDHNSISRYNDRWKKATGNRDGNLELNWTRDEPFILPPIPDQYMQGGTTSKGGSRAPSSNGMQREGSLGKGAHTKSGTKASTSVNSGASSQGTRPPPADTLQLEHRHPKGGSLGGGSLSSNSSVDQKDGHSKAGILKASTHHNENKHDSKNTAALEKHAFGGMFVSSAAPNISAQSSSALVIHGGGMGIASAGAEYHSDLPNVDVQYADENDEMLYDEDLEEMMREITTF